MKLLTPLNLAVVSTLPAAGTKGRVLTLSGDGHAYHDNGSSWDDVSGRHTLSAARTYYVATTGSDSNNGLTAGAPFLTIQKAVDTTAALDMSIYDVTIQVADGTYTGATVLKRCVGSGVVIIQGNAGTPANVLISTTSASCFSGDYITPYTIKDMKLQTTTSGQALYLTGASLLSISNLVFGACGSNHIFVSSGGQIITTSAYSITGGCSSHIRAQTGGLFVAGTSLTHTLTGTPAFSGQFAYANTGGFIQTYLDTYSGSATGKRYNAELNGIINTYGGGANFFPGSIAGTTATGGQYA